VSAAPANVEELLVEARAELDRLSQRMPCGGFQAWREAGLPVDR
jgi:hypothetical protein